jgi:hypothetical protein
MENNEEEKIQVEKQQVCPVDPAEAAQCDSCQ